MIEQDEQTVEKITRRYYVKPQDKVTALRDTYRLRRAAIKRFTERLEKTGGFIDEAEIESLRGRLGLPVERDLHFRARGPISAYIDAANQAEHIVEQITPVANAP